MISQVMLTYNCDSCGAEKDRPASEGDMAKPPLPYGWVSYDSSTDGRKRHRCLECCARVRAALEDKKVEVKEPGHAYWEAAQAFDERTIPWSEVDEGEKEKSREIEAACRKGFVPPTIVYAVRRWYKAFIAGEEDEAVARCDDVFSAAAVSVLGEEGLAEAGKLHDAALAASPPVPVPEPFKGPVEVGCWYELRNGQVVYCNDILKKRMSPDIAMTSLGPVRVVDGESTINRNWDIIRKTNRNLDIFRRTNISRRLFR